MNKCVQNCQYLQKIGKSGRVYGKKDGYRSISDILLFDYVSVFTVYRKGCAASRGSFSIIGDLRPCGCKKHSKKDETACFTEEANCRFEARKGTDL